MLVSGVAVCVSREKGYRDCEVMLQVRRRKRRIRRRGGSVEEEKKDTRVDGRA